MCTVHRSEAIMATMAVGRIQWMRNELVDAVDMDRPGRMRYDPQHPNASHRTARRMRHSRAPDMGLDGADARTSTIMGLWGVGSEMMRGRM